MRKRPMYGGSRSQNREWKAFYARLMAEAKVSSGVLRNYKAASCFVYGEAMPNLVHAILRCLKLTPDDVFYDIGSGILALFCLHLRSIERYWQRRSASSRADRCTLPRY